MACRVMRARAAQATSTTGPTSNGRLLPFGTLSSSTGRSSGGRRRPGGQSMWKSRLSWLQESTIALQRQ